MSLATRRDIDFVTGLFVLGSIIAFVFLALRAANLTEISGDDGYTIKVRFENIGALVNRAPVKSSGVLVGRVKNIVYNNEDYVAEVSLVIGEEYQFPVDSIFSIVSSNLLGGQYVSIEVGGEEKNLAEDVVLQGESAIVLEHLISKFLFDKAGE